MDARNSTPPVGKEGIGSTETESNSDGQPDALSARLSLFVADGPLHLEDYPGDGADLSLYTHGGEIHLGASWNGDGGTATASIDLSPGEADELASLLTAFAERARRSEEWVYPQPRQ